MNHDPLDPWQEADESENAARAVAEAIARASNPEMATLVTECFAHAQEHYEDGGWDVIVECWDRNQMLEFLVREKCKTVKQFVKAAEAIVGVWAERQADAEHHRREALGEPEAPPARVHECQDDSCDAAHCPQCGGHKMDWYAPGLCSECDPVNGQAFCAPTPRPTPEPVPATPDDDIPF